MKIIFTILIFSLAFTTGYAQAPLFSQYYAASLYTNPAWAGLERDIYVGMNYRSQWVNAALPFRTFQFTHIYPLTGQGVHAKHLGGFGATFLNDVAGADKEFVVRSISVGGAYNFHLNREGNNIATVGIQGGCLQQEFDMNALRWSSQYVPGAGFDSSRPGEDQFANRDFHPLINAGVLWYFTTRGSSAMRKLSVYNGVSVYNIIPQESFFNNAEVAGGGTLIKAHGGFTKALNEQTEFSPGYLFQYQNQLFQANLGAYVTYTLADPVFTLKSTTKVLVGAWYRLKDSFICSVGLSNAAWNFGFSYDANVSSLSRNIGHTQAYEFSLAYRINRQKGYKRFSSPLI